MFVLNIQSNSQITKGNWLIGGNGMFSKDKTIFPSGENVATQIDITPRIGYFIADHFAVGILGNYGWVSTKMNNIKSSYSNYGIGPFVRYYFLPLENRTNLLVETNGAYNEQANNAISAKSGFISYSVSAGPVIFLNSSVGLEFLLGYKGYKETKNDTKSNGIHFSIGIQYHLERDN